MSVKSDIVSMIKSFVAELNELHALGVKDVILDPGFGFGKDLKQNYEVLYHFRKAIRFRCPCVGWMHLVSA